ncbi:hypothetical protein FHG87_010965 [Trinorchestia longiramus]|nr:hypothetical protein FHG87_010965 [Trinorchestia longiramus]
MFGACVLSVKATYFVFYSSTLPHVWCVCFFSQGLEQETDAEEDPIYASISDDGQIDQAGESQRVIRNGNKGSGQRSPLSLKTSLKPGHNPQKKVEGLNSLKASGKPEREDNIAVKSSSNLGHLVARKCAVQLSLQRHLLAATAVYGACLCPLMVCRLVRTGDKELLEVHHLEQVLVSIVMVALLPCISTPLLLLIAHRSLYVLIDGELQFLETWVYDLILWGTWVYDLGDKELLEVHHLEQVLVSIVMVALLPCISTPLLLLIAHRSLSVEDVCFGPGMRIRVSCLAQNPTYQSASGSGISFPHSVSSDSGITDTSRFRTSPHTCPHHLELGSSLPHPLPSPSPRQYRQSTRSYHQTTPSTSTTSPVRYLHAGNEQRQKSLELAHPESSSINVSPPENVLLNRQLADDRAPSFSIQSQFQGKTSRYSFSTSPQRHGKRLSLSHSYTTSLSPLSSTHATARRKRSYEPPRSPIHLTLSPLGDDAQVSHSFNNLRSPSHFSSDSTGTSRQNYHNLSASPGSKFICLPSGGVSPMSPKCYDRPYDSGFHASYLSPSLHHGI